MLIGLSLNFIWPFLGALCNSTKTIAFFCFRSSSFGKYNVIWGPTSGQYLPKLKPFTNIKPYVKRNFFITELRLKIVESTKILNLSPSHWINIRINDFILIYIKRSVENQRTWLQFFRRSTLASICVRFSITECNQLV